MDQTQPRPDRDDEPEREASLEEKQPASATAGLRCPYCHDALAGLAGECVRCGTRHHVACFADHGGCSTHGCGSTRATTAQRDPAGTFSPLSCAICRDPLPLDAMVARCAGCGDALHVACYERVGACKTGATTCQGPVEVMPHVEAVAAHVRQLGNLLLWLGAASFAALGTFLLLAARGDAPPAAVFALFLSAGAASASVGVGLRRRSRRLAAAEPRSTGRKRGEED